MWIRMSIMNGVSNLPSLNTGNALSHCALSREESAQASVDVSIRRRELLAHTCRVLTPAFYFSSATHIQGLIEQFLGAAFWKPPGSGITKYGCISGMEMEGLGQELWHWCHQHTGFVCDLGCGPGNCLAFLGLPICQTLFCWFLVITWIALYLVPVHNSSTF